MRFLFSIFLIITSILVKGQNLVPNPGFDEILECPYEKNLIELAVPWTSANMENPDLYSTCYVEGTTHYPIPYAGRHFHYQEQRSGDCFAAIFTFSTPTTLTNEFITAPLIKYLEEGKSYYIEFYVVPDESPKFGDETFTDGIGLAFSNSLIKDSTDNTILLSLKPAIENQKGIITDTVNWTRISGCYIADGTESHAIIGNFKTNEETNYIDLGPDIFFDVCYYFIEDVLVEKFDPLPDTILLCDGESAFLDALYRDAYYEWNTGDTLSFIEVESGGKYIVEAFMEECVLRDSVIIITEQELERLDAIDTFFCASEPIELTAPFPGEYLWNTGSLNRSLIIDSEGSYSVTIQNECGIYDIEYNVEEKDCDCPVFVPNVFSPNSDGFNDELSIYFNCINELVIHDFKIYDRWGNPVYSADGSDISWDGTWNGEALQNQVFVYMLQYSIIDENGTEISHFKTGNITLLK